MNYKDLKRYLYLDTYGWIAIVSIVVCTVSGVLLAIPYDIKNPYLSVRQFLALNPPASFIRNLHYWSAQFFLVFMAFHIYDHLKRSTEDAIKKRYVWLRLTLSVAAAAYVMLSGFILKGDPDAHQARNILSSLFRSIPLAGNLLDLTFAGKPSDWQLIYIQHIATATLFIFIAIYDHVHTIWAKGRTFFVVLLVLVALSLFVGAPLSVHDDLFMKGPWYFLGLQEMLHFVQRPWIVMAISVVILASLYLLAFLKPSGKKAVKIMLLAFLSLYLVLTLTGFFFRGQNWQWQWPWEPGFNVKTGLVVQPFLFSGERDYPLHNVNGNPEACLGCHSGMKGLSDPHSESAAGCFSCHRGNPFTFNKKTAHRNMVKVPGNLSNAAETCGQPACHPGITARVKSGLMASNSGIVTVDRFVFGDSDQLNACNDIRTIQNTKASDIHLRNLCAGCHLGMEKVHTGPAEWLERGGGCNACHLHYNTDAVKSLDKIRNNTPTASDAPAFHPQIDIAVANDRCISCHSRSGRIAMNYEGWHETELSKAPSENLTNHKALPDGRVFRYVNPDIHHERGMSCIDCHNSYEVMGDGNHYAHEEEAVKVACSDCHPKGKPLKTLSLRDADRETQLIAWLRGYRAEKNELNPIHDDEPAMAVTQNGGLPLVNTFIGPDGNLMLRQKLSSKVTISRTQSPACYEGSAHNRLSCGACHSSWSPQCIGCHNSYDKAGMNFDMLKNRPVKGGWVEYSAEFLADAPVLGVKTGPGKESFVITVTPGMIMTIDKESFQRGKGTSFHRLYAPSSPHTTRREARSCKSCHLNPLAIGYGRGQLSLNSDGKWKFEPLFEKNRYDGLPEDAWTGFLKQRKGISATRTNVRPFNVEEQKALLIVGACLTCHDDKSRVMKQSLYDFQAVYNRRSSRCIIPVW